MKENQDPGKKKDFPRVMWLVRESLTHSVAVISTSCEGLAECHPLRQPQAWPRLDASY